MLGTPVPEAAVYEDDQARTVEHDIRPAMDLRLGSGVDTKASAAAMKS